MREYTEYCLGASVAHASCTCELTSKTRYSCSENVCGGTYSQLWSETVLMREKIQPTDLSDDLV